MARQTTGELDVLVEAGETPVLLSPNGGWLASQLGVAPVIFCQRTQEIKDAAGAVIMEEYSLRVIVFNNGRTSPVEPAALPAPDERHDCAAVREATRQGLARSGSATSAAPPPLARPNAPVCAHIQPEATPPQYATENYTLPPVPDFLTGKEPGHGWDPYQRVTFGRHAGMTLANILRTYGADALWEYKRRGESQMRFHSDTDNPQAETRFYWINRCMVKHINALLVAVGSPPPPPPPSREEWRNHPAHARANGHGASGAGGASSVKKQRRRRPVQQGAVQQ